MIVFSKIIFLKKRISHEIIDLVKLRFFDFDAKLTEVDFRFNFKNGLPINHLMSKSLYVFRIL